MIRYFSDRSQAGGLLAKKLKVNYANKPDVLVLGLPRGGLLVAYEVAKLLHAPLDICIVRKLGEPGYKEVAMGAIGTAREPLPPEPGKPERYDYQYERNGVNNLFMFFEPLGYWRHVEVTDQRTAIDYAQQMKYLVDERYPNAIAITVIHDQLNTHVPASLYKAFEPNEACADFRQIRISLYT